MSTASKYQWKYGNIGTDYYHDSDGLIVGKVYRGSFSDETYIAEARGKGLGEYINQKSAKRAVEISVDNKTFDMRPISDDLKPKDGYNGIGEHVATWNQSLTGENH